MIKIRIRKHPFQYKKMKKLLKPNYTWKKGDKDEEKTQKQRD